MNKPPPSFRSFYYHFGIDLTLRGTELKGRCPFCAKDDHFSVTPQQGLFNCLRCGKQGNHYTFMDELVREGQSITTIAHYEQLSENRGLDVATLTNAGLVKSPSNDAWLIPSRNQEGKLTNLYQAIPKNGSHTTSKTSHRPIQSSRVPPRPLGNSPGSKRNTNLPPKWNANNGPQGRIGNSDKSPKTRTKFEIRSAAYPCSQQLYGLEFFANQPLIVLVEGHWDRLALWEVFANLGVGIKSGNQTCFDADYSGKGTPDYFGPLFQEMCILAVPGANQFKPEWSKFLKGRHVILIYDNEPDRVICSVCKGLEGYRAHLSGTDCPMCGGSKTTGTIINPGRDGIRKVVKELDDTGIIPLSLRQVSWRAEDPKDIRDVLCL